MSSRGNRRILRIIYLLIGFLAVSGQVFFLRELLVIFQGNELSLGFCLAAWLLWTSLGSILTGRFFNPSEPKRALFFLLTTEGILLPLTLTAIRLSRSVYQSVSWEAIGPTGILLICFITLAPFCLFSGGLFSIASRVESEQPGKKPETGTSSVYFWEAIGSGIAGILVSIFLVTFFSPYQSIFLLSSLAFCAASCLKGSRIQIMMLLGSFFWLISGTIFFSTMLDDCTNQYLWRGFKILRTLDSRYSRITVTEQENSRSIYINGVVASTFPNLEIAEETVHFALLSHPQPRSLLLIGGGLNGSIQEAFKYSSLEKIDYVELDPEVVRLADKYFPPFSDATGDNRVSFYLTDGLLFLRRNHNPYDVIIVSAPEPLSVQLNRFYTVEFFQAVSDSLKPNGVFSFSVSGSENYVPDNLADYFRILYASLNQVFSSVAVYPGSLIHFTAARHSVSLQLNADVFAQRMRSRGVAASFVSEDFLPFRLTEDRIDRLRSLLEEQAAPLNEDFLPVGYLAWSKVWYSQFGTQVNQLFQALQAIDYRTIVGLLLTAVVVLAIVLGLQMRGQPVFAARSTAIAAIFSAGVIGMSLELFLLLGFQVVYGYLFYQIILITGAFMFGVAAGSYGFLNFLKHLNLKWTLGILCSVSIMIPFLTIAGIQTLTEIELPPFIVAWLIFPLASLCAGILGGVQFPLSSFIYFKSPGRRNLGILYGVDVFGACLASILLSGWFLPVYGFHKSAILIGLTSLLPIVLVLLSSRVASQK